MNCEYCQSPVHIWFQCPKKPDGWKPARLAKKSLPHAAGSETNAKGGAVVSGPDSPRGEAGSNPAMLRVAAETKSTAPLESRTSRSRSANESLPVDTNSPAPASKNRARQPRAETGHNLSETIVASGDGISGRVGGASKFDKKTWQRNYMRTYIRQYRDDVKSGKRTPKPRA